MVLVGIGRRVQLSAMGRNLLPRQPTKCLGIPSMYKQRVWHNFYRFSTFDLFLFFLFFLSYLIFLLAFQKSNQPLRFIILNIWSIFSKLQFFLFRIIYEIKDFFNFIAYRFFLSIILGSHFFFYNLFYLSGFLNCFFFLQFHYS